MRYPVVLKDVGYASTGFVPRNTSKNDRLYFMACIYMRTTLVPHGLLIYTVDPRPLAKIHP